MSQLQKVILVTGNEKKRFELEIIMGGGFPFEFDNKSIDLPEFQGEPEEIAVKKCEMAVKRLNCPVIVEDTSLCFNALGGMPGPYIKWFYEKSGNENIFRMLKDFDDKSAYALCAVAYSNGKQGDPIKVFCGKCDGTIVAPKDGQHGFGWDPIFMPKDSTKTFAEMDVIEKNEISHRNRALLKLKEFLENMVKEAN